MTKTTSHAKGAPNGEVKLLASSSFNRSLIISGATLFLLGLLQGAAVQWFVNPKMALSAHLTAVQSGMALMIVGVIWPLISLKAVLATTSRRLLIISMYGLWTGLTLSAATGASEVLPIAGAGHQGTWLAETGVSTVVLVSSGLMISGWMLLLAGLIKRDPS